MTKKKVNLNKAALLQATWDAFVQLRIVPQGSRGHRQHSHKRVAHKEQVSTVVQTLHVSVVHTRSRAECLSADPARVTAVSPGVSFSLATRVLIVSAYMQAQPRPTITSSTLKPSWTQVGPSRFILIAY